MMMDSLVLDSPYIEELFLFESEENTATSSEDESDEEAHNLDGFSSSEESDDDENIPSIPVCIENTHLKKAKLEGNLAAKVRIFSITYCHSDWTCCYFWMP
jgi:hypothetical protein